MKAVTDTRYYDEIARTLMNYHNNLSLPMQPSQMGNAIKSVIEQNYQAGYAACETDLLWGAW